MRAWIQTPSRIQTRTRVAPRGCLRSLGKQLPRTHARVRTRPLPNRHHLSEGRGCVGTLGGGRRRTGDRVLVWVARPEYGGGDFYCYLGPLRLRMSLSRVRGPGLGVMAVAG